jgi:hypothetical protein
MGDRLDEIFGKDVALEKPKAPPQQEIAPAPGDRPSLATLLANEAKQIGADDVQFRNILRRGETKPLERGNQNNAPAGRTVGKSDN